MSPNDSFHCRVCDGRHPGPPLAFELAAPDLWNPETAKDPFNELDGEICLIKGRGFFVRGLIEIPIIGETEPFAWNTWVSLSKGDFVRVLDLWDEPGRVDEQPYAGSLANDLPCQSSPTLGLEVLLHSRPVGARPLIELKSSASPLAVEQRNGISVARVQGIASSLSHLS